MNNKQKEIIEKFNLDIKEDIVIDDNDETVTCRICGFKNKRLYGHHFKSVHNNIKSDDYRILFPGAPIMSSKDLKSTTINGGKHMQTDKYKKMFSEMFSGEKNPMHSSKTTKEFRQQNSPFSKEFYKKRNPDKTEEEIKESVSKFAKFAIKDRIGTTDIRYYLNKGMTEEAKAALKDRQTTFSLEKLIKKYGVKKARIIFNKRQKKWMKSLIEGGNLKSGYSEISQKLFRSIDSSIANGDFYYATKDKEYFISEKGYRFKQYDFCDRTNKKIIEFNGDMYHANPKTYKSTDRPNPFKAELTAGMIWENDKKKIKLAKDNGFEVLIVWESDYRKDTNAVVRKCVEFLEFKI